MVLPVIGHMAPAIKLPDQHGDTVVLKDFRGSKNVLVYFYPRAMTPGCTVQACGLRDSREELEALDTVVLGISPDPVAKLGRFVDKHELNFTLLSDEDHAVAEKYGVWGLKKFMGKESMGILRTSFVIDKEGRLRHIFDKVKTKTHHDDLMSYIRDNL